MKQTNTSPPWQVVSTVKAAEAGQSGGEARFYKAPREGLSDGGRLSKD